MLSNGLMRVEPGHQAVEAPSKAIILGLYGEEGSFEETGCSSLQAPHPATSIDLYRTTLDETRSSNLQCTIIRAQYVPKSGTQSYTAIVDGVHHRVKLECAEGEDLTLPDTAYLDCHHHVAILHASGLAEYIERKIQDWEDLKQSGGADGSLRPDGSRDITRILETALWTAVTG
ncbi:hypothetical protein CDV55_105785 [Aspergillus turcosus]|uniref:Uncharacterized protein n=1 Tax=Aspergillus turcosus TaxID=1245748 RepID=A0A397H389_9EURO|nr:hypothetical protein CDV55_105785 [Aspergillus turcosus]RLL93601.1 hypothetical protein CFD26_102282 [Aspergillus turcosus]